MVMKTRVTGEKDKSLRMQGSVTVEASLLMSVILMVLFLILQMDLLLTDQTRMTALLAEDCTYSAQEERERNLWISEERKGFFYLEAERMQRSSKAEKVTVSYPSVQVALGYGHRVDPAQEITRKERDPVKYIRMIAAVAGGR